MAFISQKSTWIEESDAGAGLLRKPFAGTGMPRPEIRPVSGVNLETACKTSIK